jgi:isopentenyldiphosphate isomerase
MTELREMTETELAEQAPLAAHTWMTAAIRRVDEELGVGFAKAHPELIGAFMSACAMDYAASSVRNQLAKSLAAIALASRVE